jgi:hypothetical protein
MGRLQADRCLAHDLARVGNRQPAAVMQQSAQVDAVDQLHRQEQTSPRRPGVGRADDRRMIQPPTARISRSKRAAAAGAARAAISFTATGLPKRWWTAR